MAYTKYSSEVIQAAVNKSTSVMGVMRELGLQPVGGNHTYMTKRIKDLGIDVSHFKGQHHAKGVSPVTKKRPEEILILLPEGSNRQKTDQLVRALKEIGVEYVCGICGIDKWLDKLIVLHVDHIDGDWLNNLKENLRFLCPNCHSQTETYCKQKHMRL